MVEPLSESDVHIIADRRIEDYMAKFEARLPIVMKPTIYEVAEKVGQKHKAFLTSIFNVNLDSPESIEEFQAVLRYNKESFRKSQSDKSTIRKLGIAALFAALLTYLGLKG